MNAIRFPRARATIGWLLAFAAVAVVICVVGLAAGTTTARAIAGIALVIILAAVFRIVRQRPAELADGILRLPGFLRTRDIPLAHARDLSLNPNPGGFGQLHIRPAHGRGAYLTIAVRNPPFVTMTLPPDDLERLGNAMLATDHIRAEDVRLLLHLQAEHLRAGGTLDRAPLRGPDRADGERFRGLDTITMLIRRASPPG